MRTLLILASFGITVFCWGAYGPVLHNGSMRMGEHAYLRPFVCVGLAYFAIGVVVPLILLRLRGEQGTWTFTGAMWSLVAGAVGAIGALGILLAFKFGGRPVFVMPLVFGGAPVVNAFLTIVMARKIKEIGPVFIAGLIMVTLGAVVVLLNKPGPVGQEAVNSTLTDFVWRIAFVITTILAWGCYGPTLHKGQAAMMNSRLRPLLCVGISYFLIAVVIPYVLLFTVLDETSTYTFSGTLLSLGAGAAGAVGALGIIMAFNFGGKPVYVMPLVFGGAPVVNTFIAMWGRGTDNVHPFFWSGLILVIAGAAIVLVFAPKGPPQGKPAKSAVKDSPPRPGPTDSPAADRHLPSAAAEHRTDGVAALGANDAVRDET